MCNGQDQGRRNPDDLDGYRDQFRQRPHISAKIRRQVFAIFLGGDGVTLLGEVEIVHDAVVKKALWQDWFIEHFPKGIDDPEYCILRFDANKATCWIDKLFETHCL